MKLDGYLRANGFMRLEEPPELWEAVTDDLPFVRLLGEMIVLALRGGAPVEELTLSAANVTIGPSASSETLPVGDYVAITVRGAGKWSHDVRWAPGMARPDEPLRCLPPVIEAASGRSAYARGLEGEGSVTVLLARDVGRTG